MQLWEQKLNARLLLQKKLRAGFDLQNQIREDHEKFVAAFYKSYKRSKPACSRTKKPQTVPVTQSIAAE